MITNKATSTSAIRNMSRGGYYNSWPNTYLQYGSLQKQYTSMNTNQKVLGIILKPISDVQ